MVVTPCARSRESQEGLRINVNQVVDNLDLILQRVDGHESQFDHPQVRRPDGRLIELFLSVPPGFGQQIAGNLLANQLVVRHIIVERPNQVIAIPIGIGQLGIALAAVRFAVPNEVHPVTCPTFTEPGRFKQPVHNSFECGI